MSQALYRKYRSQTFAELVGQSAVTRILMNSIVRGRLSHAYLFCGPRGTGKTSVARIFAKALSCLEPQDGDACGKCEHCRMIAQGNAPDVIEIDAASNRGVDHIRELRERVKYAPAQFERKVYIIDEVHMITNVGFNALLKTLEEPPTHVVFCLCTTEPHKLPVTILSRVIRFDFTRLPLAELGAHLSSIAAAEGYTLAADAAQQLAELAEGSARDAISLLDQLLVFTADEITTAAIHELFQLGDPELPRQTVDLLLAGEPEPLLNMWETLLAQGAEPGQFLLRVANELKTRYLAQPAPALRRALEKLWEGLNLLKFESFPAVLVELTLLNAQAALLTPEPAGPAEHAPAPGREQAPKQPQAAPGVTEGTAEPDPSQQVKPLRQRPQEPTGRQPEPDTKPEPSNNGQAEPPGMTQDKPEAEPARKKSQPQPPAASHPRWDEFYKTLKQLQLATVALTRKGVELEEADGHIVLRFAAEFESQFRFIQKETHYKALRQAVRKVFGDSTGLRLELTGSGQQIDVIPVGGKPDAASGAAEDSAKPPRKPPPPELDSDYSEYGEDEATSKDQQQPKPRPGPAPASDAEELTADIARETGDRPKKPPKQQRDKGQLNSQDVMNLFDAEEIDTDDNAEETT